MCKNTQQYLSLLIGGCMSFNRNVFENKFGFTLAEGAMHVNLPLSRARFGFTLSEVLITLGIIGVVAAMTIPNLITNYQKHVTVTKLQKAISVLNQAYKMSFDEVGEPSLTESFAMGGQEYFNKYWAPYIKSSIYCTTYQQCGYKSSQPFKDVTGKSIATAVVSVRERATFYTPDGFLYILFTSGGNENGEVIEIHYIIVDINGGEGPNRIGRDVFYLTRVNEDGAGIQPYCYTSNRATLDKYCNKTNGGGSCCAEKIRRAGWKIDKSYPW